MAFIKSQHGLDFNIYVGRTTQSFQCLGPLIILLLPWKPRLYPDHPCSIKDTASQRLGMTQHTVLPTQHSREPPNNDDFLKKQLYLISIAFFPYPPHSLLIHTRILSELENHRHLQNTLGLQSSRLWGQPSLCNQ